MPTRTGASTATEVIEPEEPQHLMPGLQFNEPLSWRAGKPIAVAELLRRLQTLAKEMRDMEQEENERNSFTKVAKELASPNLLGHKDKGVKAWTAYCLVDILRLCAPDAPYSGQQLRDIFNMFITSIIPALSDPSNAYNTQHLYVLNSLAQVKSIVLLTDIPSSEPLIINLFASFFDILSGSSKTFAGEKLGKDVEFNLTQILIIMVDESATVHPEVIDIIVAQFLRTDPRVLHGGTGKSKKDGAIPVVDDKQSTLVMRQLPPAYNMAKAICNHCPDKMARYISQYFNDVIVDASKTSISNGAGKNHSRRRNSLDDSEDDNPSGPTEEDLKELRKVHGLLRELWRASPAVLQNVIPQLEAELSAENVQLRLLATEALGDIISGIGAAGLPSPPIMDPAAYPPLGLSDVAAVASLNLLTKPSSPQPFTQAHPQAYTSFLGRTQDKSPLIRAAWTTGIGRILMTSAGGIGLSRKEEDHLIAELARMMQDADEKVRVAAVKVVGHFEFRDVIIKLGSSGSVTKPGSVLAILGDRVRDKKHGVRVEAMRVLGRIWGVAAGEIAAGNEQVISIVGGAPSRILDAYYTNELDVNVLLDHVIFEQLLPLSYPPIKAKSAKAANGNSQKVKDSQPGEASEDILDPDKIRTERILTFAKDLDDRAKKVFFAIQSRQLEVSKVLSAYLQRCEDYNGGVMDENETQIKEHMKRLIGYIAKSFPDSSKATADLWKFAKMHDRRSYQLMRFCMAPDSDYRTVFKALKELTKRIETSTTAPAGLLETLTPLLYRASVIVCNKSHVPAIMEYSRTDNKSLADIAHEILREISSRTPEVLKAHVQEICRVLQEQAPTAKKVNDAGAVHDLKACASFTSKFPKEVPQDRKFVQAMMSFALYGSPPEAAKHAVSILMTASDKKEILAKDLLRKCVEGFEYGGDGFLSRLATLAQLELLTPLQVDEEGDAILDIAIKQILLQVRTTSTDRPDAYVWSATVDIECAAKCWALKILVNRLHSNPTDSTLADNAAPIYNLLLTLVSRNGKLTGAEDTPSTHKPRLRLLAARLYLKLCTKKPLDALLSPAAFISLSEVAQDKLIQVRSGFLKRLKKYLGQQKLPQRFYTILFLLAFEPSHELKSEITTWIRSRASFFSNLKSQQTGSASSGKANIVMESIFARLVSLLAHHTDYSSVPEDLTDFARYFLFYLQTVATEENISLIYHIAQRIKQCRDAVPPPISDDVESADTFDDNIYHLSDLAQLTISKFEEAHSWSIQTLPAKIRLPNSLFSEINSHEDAQSIAERNYLSEGVEEVVENLVRQSMRAGRGTNKKRRSEVGGGDYEEGRENKKAKSLPIRKAVPKEKKAGHQKAGTARTPKKPKRATDESTEAASERRRSGRVQPVGGKSYTEREDEEDDEEMEVLEWEIDGEVQKMEKREDEDVAMGDEEEDNESEHDIDVGEESREDEMDVEENSEPEPEKDLTPEPAPLPSPKGKRKKPPTPKKTSKVKAKSKTTTTPAPPTQSTRATRSKG